MMELDAARDKKKGGEPSKWPTAEQINANMSKVPVEDPELTARDGDVAASQARTEPAKSPKDSPPKKGDAVQSKQGTMELSKPSPTALRIIRAILAANDIGKKVRAFEKKLYANLDVQMKADKTDFLEVDGVPFRRENKTKVKMGAFTDWRPVEDSTTALLKLLGVSADDFKAASGEEE